MLNAPSFNPKEPDRDTYIKVMAMEAGWVGRVFGSAKNAPLNIAGFVAAVVVLAGLVVTVTAGGPASAETWKILAPIVTMVLGFVFGKKA